MNSVQVFRAADAIPMGDRPGFTEYETLSISERTQMLKALQRAVRDVEHSLEMVKKDKDSFVVIDEDSAVDVSDLNDFVHPRIGVEILDKTTSRSTNINGHARGFDDVTTRGTIVSNPTLKKSVVRYRRSKHNTMPVFGLKGDHIMYIHTKRHGADIQNTWSVFSHIPDDANIDIRKEVHFFSFKGDFHMSVGAAVWRKRLRVNEVIDFDHDDSNWSKKYVDRWEYLGDRALPGDKTRSVVPFVRVRGEEVDFHLLVLDHAGRLQALQGSLTEYHKFVELKGFGHSDLRFLKITYGDNHITAYDTDHNIWDLTPDFSNHTFTVQGKRSIEPFYELTTTDIGLVGVREDGWIYRQVRPITHSHSHELERSVIWEKWIKQNGVLHLGMASPHVTLGLEKYYEEYRDTRSANDLTVGLVHTDRGLSKSTSHDVAAYETSTRSENTSREHRAALREAEALIRNLPVNRIVKRRRGLRDLERLIAELRILTDEDSDLEDTYYYKDLGLRKRDTEEWISDRKLDDLASRNIILNKDDGRSKYVAVYNQSNLVITSGDEHKRHDHGPKNLDRVIVVSPPHEPVYVPERRIEERKQAVVEEFVEVDKTVEVKDIKSTTKKQEIIETKVDKIAEVKNVQTRDLKQESAKREVEIARGLDKKITNGVTAMTNTRVETVGQFESTKIMKIIEKTTATPIVVPGWFTRKEIELALALYTSVLPFSPQIPNSGVLNSMLTKGRQEVLVMLNTTIDLSITFEEWIRRFGELTVHEVNLLRVDYYDKSIRLCKAAIDSSRFAGNNLSEFNQKARYQRFEIERQILLLEDKLRSLEDQLQDVRHQVWSPTWVVSGHVTHQNPFNGGLNVDGAESKIVAEIDALKVQISQYTHARDICRQFVDNSQTWLRLCSRVSKNLEVIFNMLVSASFELSGVSVGAVSYKALLITEWRQIRREAEEIRELIKTARQTQTTVATKSVRNGEITYQVDTLANITSPHNALSQQLQGQSISCKNVGETLSKLRVLTYTDDIVGYADSRHHGRVTLGEVVENVRTTYTRLAAINYETVEQISNIAQLQPQRSRNAARGKMSSHAFLRSTLNAISSARNRSVRGKDLILEISAGLGRNVDYIKRSVTQLKEDVAAAKVELKYPKGRYINRDRITETLAKACLSGFATGSLLTAAAVAASSGVTISSIPAILIAEGNIPHGKELDEITRKPGHAYLQSWLSFRNLLRTVKDYPAGVALGKSIFDKLNNDDLSLLIQLIESTFVVIDGALANVDGIRRPLDELLASVKVVSEILSDMEAKCVKYAERLDFATPLPFNDKDAAEVDAKWQQVAGACDRWLIVFNEQGISPLSYMEI